MSHFIAVHFHRIFYVVTIVLNVIDLDFTVTLLNYTRNHDTFLLLFFLKELMQN